MDPRRSYGWVSAPTLVLGLGSCGAPTSPQPVEALDTSEGSAAAESSTTASWPGDDPTASDGTADEGPGRDDGAGPSPPDLGSPPDEPAPGFTDVTEAAGLSTLDPGPLRIPPWCLLDDVQDPEQPGDLCFPERFLGAGAAADYDGDGWPDLYLTSLEGPDHLLRNRGDGSFEEVTAAAGLDQPRATGGVAWLDVEGDGDLDLLLTTFGGPSNLLFVNDGRGHFDEQGQARGVAVLTGTPHLGMGIGVGDYDLDGWLDLFVADWHPDAALGNAVDHNRLLHGVGADAPGTFEDLTAAMGIDLPAVAPLVDAKPGTYGFAPAFVDLDDDGWPELTLAGDFGTSRLWWNESGQALVDGTLAAGVGTERNGMGSTFGDIDGDGDLDWFVSAISTPRFPELGNRLYRNEGDGTLLDVTDAYGLRDGGWGWGAAFFDAELDGDLDLILAAGWPSTEFSDDGVSLWLNEGEGPWPQRAEALGIEIGPRGRGVLPFDHDRDGDLDLLVLGNTDPPTLLRNDMATGRWLVVEAQGRGGNPRSLGATVRVQAEPDGGWQVRTIGVGSHLFGQQEAVAHFGLGAIEHPVHRVEVSWPATGQQVVLEDVTLDQWLVVAAP